MDQDIHGLRIRNGVTTPTSPLVPPKVEGLDTLNWHVGSVIEDESDVSWKACSLADISMLLLILTCPLPLCPVWLVNPWPWPMRYPSDDPLIYIWYCIDPYDSCCMPLCIPTTIPQSSCSPIQSSLLRYIVQSSLVIVCHPSPVHTWSVHQPCPTLVQYI